MSFEINPAINASSVNKPNGDLKKRFDDEKNAALSAAHGNASLLSRINSITPHKGAIEELEALLLEATRTQNSALPNRTLGIG